MTENIFEYNGLIKKSAFHASEWKNIYDFLEDKQRIFITKERQFKNPDYKWPNDALHNWSRIWEYPYAYYQLHKFVQDWTKASKPKVLDFGSGLTFLPFLAIELGFEVYCTDIDTTLAEQYKNACKVLGLPADSVKFLPTIESAINIDSDYFDYIYSISVLEHIPSPEVMISELFRILKPDGLLLLTLDLDMQGNSQINLPSYLHLRKEIIKYFDDYYPYSPIHPLDILYSDEGQYKLKFSSKYLIKRIVISIMKNFHKNKFQRKLACESNVFIKKNCSNF